MAGRSRSWRRRKSSCTSRATSSRASPTTSATATCRCRSVKTSCASKSTMCSRRWRASSARASRTSKRRSSPRPGRTTGTTRWAMAARSTTISMTSLARLLQLASPTLPVGAYSYSQGLEAAVEAGIVTDAESAQRWIGDVLEFSVAKIELTVLRQQLVEPSQATNDLFLASRETAELRAETVQMGQSLAKLLTDLGIDGPVGSGKTALTLALCRALRSRYQIAVVTNDIYTEEDAQFLVRNEALAAERIIGVETGGCPHTAIREDASINLEAVSRLTQRFPKLDLVFIESGGDNLAATFSPELSDLTLYVIDVAAGHKIPRKGGPGIPKSDRLVMNKIDLAPMVGAPPEVMAHDAKKMRGERPFQFTNLKTGDGLQQVIRFIETEGML